MASCMASDKVLSMLVETYIECVIRSYICIRFANLSRLPLPSLSIVLSVFSTLTGGQNVSVILGNNLCLTLPCKRPNRVY